MIAVSATVDSPDATGHIIFYMKGAQSVGSMCTHGVMDDAGRQEGTRRVLYG